MALGVLLVRILERWKWLPPMVDQREFLERAIFKERADLKGADKELFGKYLT